MSCPSTATVYGATENVLLGDELAELVSRRGAHHRHALGNQQCPSRHPGHPLVVDAVRAGQTSLKG